MSDELADAYWRGVNFLTDLDVGSTPQSQAQDVSVITLAVAFGQKPESVALEVRALRARKEADEADWQSILARPKHRTHDPSR